jgi:hypothetical protein
MTRRTQTVRDLVVRNETHGAYVIPQRALLRLLIAEGVRFDTACSGIVRSE